MPTIHHTLPADVMILRSGGMIGFELCTRRARGIFTDEIGTEPWMWLGSTLWVDEGNALVIFDAINDFGLVSQ